MTRATLPGFLCLLVAAPLLASEAWLLQIPKRNVPDQEIGEVRITLGLDLPPGGSQLSINNSATLNLGETQTIAGDEVSFTAGTGNSVLITYKPLSNFGADFCAGANAAEKNVRMRFVGLQDVLDFRLSTYIVAAPQAACAKVSKRTGELPAFLIPEQDGDTSSLDAIFRGRQELDTILVLDASGSMGSLPPGASSGPSKASLLRSALTTFVAQWAELDAPFEGANESPNDRMGVLFFDDTVTLQSINGGDPPQNFFVRRTNSPAGPDHPWNAVEDVIDTLTPGQTTALGAGINAAMEQWLADADNDLGIVVVTDGIQNAGPQITTGANGLLELASQVPALPSRLADRFVPLQTIGFGVPAAVDATLLTALSQQTAGVSFIAVDDETVFDSLAFTLIALLRGNTASLASRIRGTTTGEHQVLVDPSAQRVVFSLQWAPPDENMLTFEVFRPGANGPAAPASTTLTKQSVIQSFVPGKGDIGVWRVRVKRKASSTKAVPYTLNTFVNERSLDYRLSFDTPHGKTGESIRLRASVAYDGKPLKGLPPNAIKVRVRRPAQSLGSILHASKAVASVTAGKDPLSAYQAKIAKVVNAHVLQRILPRDEVITLPLREEKPGVYSAVFTDTSVAGTYAFDVVLDWDDKRTGHLHREERVERTVEVKVDPASSSVVVRGNRVTITPRDRFGNYLGPGFETKIRPKAADPTQTGTYQLTVRDGERITIDGVVVPTKRP